MWQRNDGNASLRVCGCGVGLFVGHCWCTIGALSVRHRCSGGAMGDRKTCGTIGFSSSRKAYRYAIVQNDCML